MTTQNGRAFNEWLRAQLKAKRMSQRQLAQQSGVDHSTISRLIRGDRMPSLGTATKLARGLREIRDDADTPVALGVVSLGPQNPTARVEYALRADEALSEPQVHQVMEYYLAVRAHRFGRTYTAVGAADAGTSSNRPNGPNVPNVFGNVGVHGRSPGVPAAAAVRAPNPRMAPSRYGVQRPAARPPVRPPARAPGRP